MSSSNESEIVAYIYEYKKVSAKTGRSMGGWTTYIDDTLEAHESPEDVWQATDDGKEYKFRNVCALVYGDDIDDERVVAYEFQADSRLGDRTINDIILEDPRGDSTVESVKPLIPVHGGKWDGPG